MNTLKEVPHPDAIEHAIEVLQSCFDHPEADEAISGLTLLREQLKWAHHTPALLSEADAAADLAGVARPGAEPVASVPVRLLKRWRDAFAEELAAYDIQPPIHHVQTSHDEIEAILKDQK